MQLVTDSVAKSLGGSSFIRKMFEKGIELKKKFGEDAVCDFSLGNPDVPPPAKTREVLIKLADRAVTPCGVGYCPNAGIPEVRAAMAKYLSKQQETEVAAKDVVMSVGAAGALVSFFRSVISRGDEVITPAPYFVEYGSYCGHFGGVLKTVPSIAPAFHLDIPAIEAAINSKTRVIIINSPNNPTGCIYTQEELKEVARIVDNENERRLSHGKRPMFIVSDEPYRVFAFDGVKVPPMLPLSKWTCVLGSFSKSLSLPGERVGYFLANPAMPEQASLIQAVTLMTRTLGYVNSPVIGQRLAAELTEETVDLEIYDRRRRLMTKILREAGLEFEEPKGAFYFFVKSPLADDFAFVDALAEENILAVPGTGFGFSGYIRICCAVDEKVIARSADGFKKVMKKFR